jgi:hypothetical protein
MLLLRNNMDSIDYNYLFTVSSKAADSKQVVVTIKFSVLRSNTLNLIVLTQS